MRILAIDPGSALGWATDSTGRLEWGEEAFGIRNGESSGNRWRRFGEWLNDVTLRIGIGDAAMSRDESAARGAKLVDLIVYERSVFAPKARAAAEIAAGFTTRLEEHCERHGIALQPVAPATLKRFATGKGNADKAAMCLAALTRLQDMVRWQPASTIQEGDYAMLAKAATGHNVADALWLYWWAKENVK